MRVSTIPTVNGESISLRLLSRTDVQHFGLDRLDMSAAQIQSVKALLQQPNGIILVTGPTGSGKSTSLYCFLSAINAVSRRIITIEEPVGIPSARRQPDRSEIRDRPHLCQWPAGHPAPGSKHRHGRRDPRLRDLRDRHPRAMTGHLVFSTLHTNDAVSGITRPARHGHRALPPRQCRPLLSGPASRPDDLPGLPGRDQLPARIPP
ncbi:MAG: ATPase, T2SS/T4P/T4SS family [Chthoniobacter sp.]